MVFQPHRRRHNGDKIMGKPSKIRMRYLRNTRIDKLKKGRATTLQKAIATALNKYLNKDEKLHDWEFKFEIGDVEKKEKLK